LEHSFNFNTGIPVSLLPTDLRCFLPNKFSTSSSATLTLTLTLTLYNKNNMKPISTLFENRCSSHACNSACSPHLRFACFFSNSLISVSPDPLAGIHDQVQTSWDFVDERTQHDQQEDNQIFNQQSPITSTRVNNNCYTRSSYSSKLNVMLQQD
jgi:hypothetical protein